MNVPKEWSSWRRGVPVFVASASPTAPTSLTRSKQFKPHWPGPHLTHLTDQRSNLTDQVTTNQIIITQIYKYKSMKKSLESGGIGHPLPRPGHPRVRRTLSFHWCWLSGESSSSSSLSLGTFLKFWAFMPIYILFWAFIPIYSDYLSNWQWYCHVLILNDAD